MAKQVELSVRCVVKGYHECPFEVNVGEIFYAFKKRGERGNAFRVTNDRGQLGHLQIELVGPLWPYYSAIFPFGCTGECSRCMFLACMRIFRQHDSERRQKQFPQLINKLEESDTEETLRQFCSCFETIRV